MEEEHLGETSIEKPKKPRSEKQLAAFDKARAKRVENAKIKKEKIDEIKEKAKNMQLVDEVKVKDEKPNSVAEDNSDTDTKIKVVKKQKKKPKTRIIYQEESSDTDEDLVIVRTKKEKKQVLDSPVISKVPVIKFI